MNAPLVAVTAANTPDKRGFDRASLNLTYLRALEEPGAIPLVIAPGMAREHIAAALERCSGLVLTGGGDVNPERYGEQPHATIIGVSEARDAMEFAALDIAFELGLPVLALCRGMQVLNVWRGGALIQDIPSIVPGAFPHSVQEPRHAPAHSVSLRERCRLADVLRSATVDVNSRHHQAVSPEAIGDGLVVTGRSLDGVIEAVELPGEQFVLGAQWHPEDMATGPEDGLPRQHARALFAAFTAEARCLDEQRR